MWTAVRYDRAGRGRSCLEIRVWDGDLLAEMGFGPFLSRNVAELPQVS